MLLFSDYKLYLCTKITSVMILEKIEKLLKEVSNVSAKNAEDVEQLRLKYLSKKGEINALMGEFRNVAADQKKTVGMKINELKQLAQDKINDLREQLETNEAQSSDIDLTGQPILLAWVPVIRLRW